MTDAPWVLVVYASRNGSTAEIAYAIGKELTGMGMKADVKSAEDTESVEGYRFVIIGSSLYAWSWERSALRFAEKHMEELKGKTVWLFSSGPLDSSADYRDIPPVRSARKLADRLGARGHVTFGGKLPEGTGGLIAKRARKSGENGDFRNFGRIRAWSAEIGRLVLDAGMAHSPEMQ